MFYTIDECRETGWFIPFMNGEKPNALLHCQLERNGMLYIIDNWRITPFMNGEKRDALQH